jgi:hypothetical protein
LLFVIVTKNYRFRLIPFFFVHRSLVFSFFSFYFYLMTITQIVYLPESHRLVIDVPREVPAGMSVISFTPVSIAIAPETNFEECPVCAAHRDPETGNPRYNAETAAAIEEGMAISRGDIPAKWYTSLDEMWEDLVKEDSGD